MKFTLGLSLFIALWSSTAGQTFVDCRTNFQHPQRMPTSLSLCNQAFIRKPLYETIGMAAGARERANDLRKGIRYFNDQDREQARIRIRDGRLYTADGSLVQTAGLKVIYVMDAYGDIYMYRSDLWGDKQIKHSSFLAGGAIAVGGRIEVKNGVVVYADNTSGHYLPDFYRLRFLKQQLEKSGAPVDQIHWADTISGN